MSDFATTFTKFGPVPMLFAVLALAVVWLVQRLNAAEERERKAREELLSGHKDATQALSGASLLIRDSLGAHDRALEKQTEGIDRLAEEMRRHVTS